MSLYIVKCPMKHDGIECEGIATLQGDSQTYLGYLNGPDPNNHIESFECSKCKAKFKRTWAWESKEK